MQFIKAYWDDSEGLIDFNNGIAVVNDKEGRTFCINKKGKETHYSNVNNKGTTATGAPFGARRIKYSLAAPNWDYTDDIIY